MSRARKLVQLLETIQESPDPPLSLLDGFRDAYAIASRETREDFFELLLTWMEVPRESIVELLRQVLEGASADDAVGWTSRLTDLRRRLESPRMRAFRRFLNASGGLKFLLDLRADIIAAERLSGLALGPLDEEIAHLFTSWFQYGFLFLHEITQESSYRQIRFLKEHDMVHPMTSLEEMGNRLGADRRSFALYHRAMPEEPIVFIEAALTRRIPSSIHEILDGGNHAPELHPDTAIFYSINNAQNGLAGLGLGKLLIFQVVDAIKKSTPQIQTFATLSPVTGFRTRYLEPILHGLDGPSGDEGFRLEKTEALKKFSERARARILSLYGGEDGDFSKALARALSSADWIEDRVLRTELERPLRQIAYFYLTQEKDPAGKPLNPVAAFHLGNGARLAANNVHFAANRTDRGLLDSCGIMVSYVYSSNWLHELRRSARAMLPWQR